jgi:hypothetical protein
MFKRLALALGLLLAPAVALAQNVLTIPQLPAAVTPLGGGEYAIVYQGSGTKKVAVKDLLPVYKASTAPTTPFFGQYWWDTSSAPADVLRIYDGAQFIGLATMDVSAHTFVVNSTLLPSLTGLLDGAFGATQGTILYRGASSWSALAPGSAGNLLQTAGPGANPAWAPLGAGRNVEINGDLRVDQRNAGASQTITAGGGNQYTVDRFYARASGASISGQRVAGTSPYAFAYKLSGATSNTGTAWGQRIEAANSCPLANSQVTQQVQIASAGLTTVTWTAYYANAADNFTSETSIASGTITITSTPTIYTFGFNAGANACNGLDIVFSTGALIGGQTIQYAGLQLEAGSFATTFERVSYGQQLVTCQRYYEVIYQNEVSITGHVDSSTRIYSNAPFKVEKRATPTMGLIGSISNVTSWGSGPGVTATALGFALTTTRGTKFYTDDAGHSFANGSAYSLYFNLGSGIYASAEL